MKPIYDFTMSGLANPVIKGTIPGFLADSSQYYDHPIARKNPDGSWGDLYNRVDEKNFSSLSSRVGSNLCAFDWEEEISDKNVSVMASKLETFKKSNPRSRITIYGLTAAQSDKDRLWFFDFQRTRPVQATIPDHPPDYDIENKAISVMKKLDPITSLCDMISVGAYPYLISNVPQQICAARETARLWKVVFPDKPVIAWVAPVWIGENNRAATYQELLWFMQRVIEFPQIDGLALWCGEGRRPIVQKAVELFLS